MFVLSILLRYLKPLLRASAGVGSWQAQCRSVALALNCAMFSLSEDLGKLCCPNTSNDTCCHQPEPSL